MDSMKYVSSPSLSSSPSTKEQSTEQPKSSEHKSMEDENKQDQKTSKSQLNSKPKNQVDRGEEDDEEEDDGREGENLQKYELEQTEQVQSQENEESKQLQKDNQIDEYDVYEDDDEEDDSYFYREGDINSDIADDGNPNSKSKKNKFTKEFMNAIRSNSEGLRNETNDEQLDYLFVIDFECNQPGSEIIEFPITVIDLKEKKVADTFHSYVRPTKIKKLSNFIKKLTGIKQEDVDASEDIQAILTRVEAFLSKYKNYKAAVLYDCANDAKFLSNEIRNKQLNVSCKFLLSYINLRNVFPIHLTGGIKNISLSHALEVLDMSFEGQKHTGRDDAINIARVCLEMTNREFVFTQFMRQSQFCNDNPKKQVDSTINDLFRMNKYIIGIDLKFYGDKKDLNTKSEMILCKSFKFHLFQIKSATTTFPSTNQSTPQKSNYKLKTVAEKIAEQQQKQQQDSQQQQQQQQLNKQNSQEQDSISQSHQQQQQQKIKQNQIEEIDSYYQEFNNLQYQLQDYYELLQNLIDLYHKHGIKNQNSLIILNSSTKQKYFSKFFKFITTMFKTSKSAFIFKKKILNLQDLLEKQIVIDKNQLDEIIMEEFPKNITKLSEFFNSQNFEVKELPQNFQKRFTIGIPEGQQSQYRDFNNSQYPLFSSGSQQYGQYAGGMYNQGQQTANQQQQQQQPFSLYQYQQQLSQDYFNSGSPNSSFNQFQMMYQLQQSQNAYSQQTPAAFLSQQPQQSSSSTTYPYYFQQAMNQMNNNLIYQMSLLNPAFSYPPNYMDSQFQQQVLFHSQQFLQQLEQNSPLLPNQSPSSTPQQLSFNPASTTNTTTASQASQQQQPHNKEQSQNLQQPQQKSTTSANSNHFKTNSAFNGNTTSQNYKNSSSNQKNEGQNVARKKNFRNNSNNFNNFNGFSNQNNNFYYNNLSSTNNNGSQSFQRTQNTSGSNINSAQIPTYPSESKHGYSSSATNTYNFHQNYQTNNVFQKSTTYSNTNKNKFYKK